MNSLSIIIILNLCVYFFVVESLPDWKLFAQQLKDKLKSVFKKKTSRSKESVSVGSSSFSAADYPKTPEALREMETLWNDYYKCLESKHYTTSMERTIFPSVVAAFSKTFIQLDCNVCVSPDDILEEAEWYFVDKPSIAEAQTVEENEHIHISAFTFTLHLSDLQSQHQGMYFCHLKNDVDVPYFLHVLDTSTEPVKEIKPTAAKTGPFAQNPMIIKNTTISIWNDWTPWTKCSTCGKIGKRTRIGYCNVGLVQSLPDDIKNNLVPSTEILNISTKALTETTNLMKYFPHGIPCRSSLLPSDFRNHPIIKNFPAEVMTGFCKVSCPSNVIFEVVDKSGNIIDSVNNSAGVYSVYQEQPLQLQTFQQDVKYVKLGNRFVLSCPNLLYKDAPVQWSVGGKLWIKENVEKASHKRIMLNDLNEIVFIRVEDVDLNKTYSCYQLKERVGAVELQEQKKTNVVQSYIDGVNLYTKVMFLSIFFTFVYIPFRMYLNREKATAGQYVPLKRKLSIREFLIEMYHDSYIGDIKK